MARPGSDIADRIVEAARKRFLAEGVEGASLRSIAKDAGTSIGMVYYYFETKDALFLAVLEESYQGLLGAFRTILGDDAEIEVKLARIYENFARLGDREFEVLRIVLREALSSSSRLRLVAERFEHGHVPLVLAALAQGVAQGRLRNDLHPAVLAAATASLAVLPQIVHRLVTAAGLPVAELLPSRDDAARAMGSVLWRGIRTGEPE
jgi:AcrR family transcriptional regulator